jgi:hypothetical protein
MEKNKTFDKLPVFGLYFPNTFSTFGGDLLINYTIDLKKFAENLGFELVCVNKEKAEKFTKKNSKGRIYTKGCIKKNKEPDKDGNLYFAFHNTYEHKEPIL